MGGMKLEGQLEDMPLHDDSENAQLLDATTGKNRRGAFDRPFWARAFGLTSHAFLLIIIIVQAFLLVKWRTELAERPPKTSKLGLRMNRDTIRSSGMLNPYWHGDSLDPENKAWDAINSGHGIISVTPEFVHANNLPETIAHPLHPEKYVYAIEAYHMIHCTQVLRRDFLLLHNNETPTKPLEHAMHCFDALRQSIMCQANDELLIITGHGHANGFNQTRQCRSWDRLRDFATENTACYWDDELPEEEEETRWNMCDGGHDGLPIGSILG